VDRLVLKTMVFESPQAQISGGWTAITNALMTMRFTFYGRRP
jgi:hypothetical protein